MRKAIRSRGIAILTAVLMVFAMTPLLPIGAGTAYADEAGIPTADFTFTEENEWEGTLTIGEEPYTGEGVTVKISGVEHSNTGDYSSAIKICNNTTANLVFEGDNVLAGNSDKTCCGIEVEEGSTVKIYGMDGSTLKVTGGNLSAGIGGKGYGNGENPRAGNINIFSGTITAIGGNKGAGIGSGNHSSASDINIIGGDITAIGQGWGAGIGSGYATSGGAQSPGVGFYDGGNIIISGGKVKAATYQIDFEKFDPYNTNTLYDDEYEYGQAAGIGGGYGSSSGNIIIKGNADVVAIGASGGAGIGTGRGTSKINQFDAEKFDCNVTIKDNAKVIAIAGDTKRANIGAEGGAGIGLGYGCTLEGSPKGTIKIEGNAFVYAVASTYAQAIGASNAVDKDTLVDAHVADLSIAPTATVIAVSDGQRPAVDFQENSDIVQHNSLNFDESYFQERSDFFTEDKFPVKIEAVDAENNTKKALFAIQKAQKANVVVCLPGANKHNYTIKDYQGTEGETIFLSNAVEENSAQFFAEPDLRQYDVTGLTARLDRKVDVDSQFGKIAVMIKAKEGIFEYGSSLFANAVSENEAKSLLDKQYSDTLQRLLCVEPGVKDRSDQNYAGFTGGKVKLYIRVPDGWDKNEIKALLLKTGGDTALSTQKTEVIGGVTYVSFETDQFGKYALFDPLIVKATDPMMAKLTAKGSRSLKLTWNKTEGASALPIC